MDYMYHGVTLEETMLRTRQNIRLQMYNRRLQSYMKDKKEYEQSCEKTQQVDTFLDRESRWEQKIYGKLKQWEKRHPIMGIMCCTILGGILLSLISEVILQVLLMYI